MALYLEVILGSDPEHSVCLSKMGHLNAKQVPYPSEYLSNTPYPILFHPLSPERLGFLAKLPEVPRIPVSSSITLFGTFLPRLQLFLLESNSCRGHLETEFNFSSGSLGELKIYTPLRKVSIVL